MEVDGLLMLQGGACRSHSEACILQVGHDALLARGRPTGRMHTAHAAQLHAESAVVGVVTVVETFFIVYEILQNNFLLRRVKHMCT